MDIDRPTRETLNRNEEMQNSISDVMSKLLSRAITIWSPTRVLVGMPPRSVKALTCTEIPRAKTTADMDAKRS